MPLTPPPIETNNDAQFAMELQALIARGEWEYLSDERLDANYDEWAEAADQVRVSAERVEVAATYVGSLLLEHSTATEHVPDTIARGLLTTHKYRVDHPEDYNGGFMGHLGNQVGYEVVLGLNDTISMSYERASPMRKGGVQFQFRAQDMLERPDTLVFPYDAPFVHGGETYAMDVALNQAIALRGTDYLKLLPTYLALHQQNRDASDAFPRWLRDKLYFGKKYRAAEIRVLGNIALPEVAWRLEVHTAVRDHAELVDALPPSIRDDYVLDRSQK